MTDLATVISDNLYGNLGKPTNWDYGDKVMFANVADMINKDMHATMKGNKLIEKGEAYETNPILRGNTDNKNAVGAYGLLSTLLLGNRWAGMNNKVQRKAEMLLAQAIQAYALNSWKEPFRVSLYSQEF